MLDGGGFVRRLVVGLEAVLDPPQAQQDLAVEQEEGSKGDNNGEHGPDPTDVDDDVALAPSHFCWSHLLLEGQCAVGRPDASVNDIKIKYFGKSFLNFLVLE